MVAKFAAVRHDGMMTKTPPTPWLELQVIRSKDGHTQTSLAEQAGLSKSYLCELESGRRRPNPRVIKLLATALNVPMSVIEPRTLKAAG